MPIRHRRPRGARLQSYLILVFVPIALVVAAFLAAFAIDVIAAIREDGIRGVIQKIWEGDNRRDIVRDGEILN